MEIKDYEAFVAKESKPRAAQISKLFEKAHEELRNIERDKISKLNSEIVERSQLNDLRKALSCIVEIQTKRLEFKDHPLFLYT